MADFLGNRQNKNYDVGIGRLVHASENFIFGIVKNEIKTVL